MCWKVIGHQPRSKTYLLRDGDPDPATSKCRILNLKRGRLSPPLPFVTPFKMMPGWVPFNGDHAPVLAAMKELSRAPSGDTK